MNPPLRLPALSFAALLLSFSALAAPAAPGPLRAGAARVDITPRVNPGYPPSGKYGHEHLFIRAIVLDNGVTRAALLGADLGGLSEDIYSTAAKQIAALLNCPVQNIIMSATHTHAGSPAGPPPPGFPRQPTEQIVAAMMDAVRQAKANLQPALVGYGAGFSYLNVNRDTVSDQTHRWTQAANLNAPSDKTVAVVSFTTPSGDPIAAYVNYAMHPINGYLVGITTADFAGAACRYVEQAFDDKMVMVFTQGASGDQNPLYLRPSTNALASASGVPATGYEMVRENIEAPLRDRKVPYRRPDPKVADRFERWIESEGDVLGEEVIRVMSNVHDRSGDVALWGAQTNISCPGRTRTGSGREGAPGTYTDGPPVGIRLGIVGIGDIALSTVNAEIYTLIGQRAKKNSPLAHTVVVTLSNGRANSGYIPDDASFGHETFQVLGSRLKPGCAEQGIANGLDSLISQYASK